jgi:hypothetical protein
VIHVLLFVPITSQTASKTEPEVNEGMGSSLA